MYGEGKWLKYLVGPRDGATRIEVYNQTSDTQGASLVLSFKARPGLPGRKGCVGFA